MPPSSGHPNQALHRSRGDLALVAFGLILASFAAYQQFKLPVVLPSLLALYGYPKVLAGALMSVYALSGMFMSVLVGRWIGRGHLRPVLLIAGGLMLAGNAFGLVAPHLGWVMLASRGLEGLAFAIMAILGPVIANGAANPRHLPIVIGLTAAWIPFGQLFATLCAHFGLTAFGWESLWLVAAFGTVVLLVWGQWALAGKDVAGKDVASPRQKKEGAGPQAAGLTQSQTIKLILTAVIFLFWSGQYFAFMTWLPVYLTEIRGLDLSGALAGYVVPVALVAVFCLVTGYLLRQGLRAEFLLVGALIGQIVSWALVPWSGQPLIGTATLLLYGLCAGIVPTCLFAMPSRILGSGPSTARAFGIVMTGRNSGVFLGPILLPWAIGLSGNWAVIAPLFALVTLAALAGALALVKAPGDSHLVR